MLPLPPPMCSTIIRPAAWRSKCLQIWAFKRYDQTQRHTGTARYSDLVLWPETAVKGHSTQRLPEKAKDIATKRRDQMQFPGAETKGQDEYKWPEAAAKKGKQKL